MSQKEIGTNPPPQGSRPPAPPAPPRHAPHRVEITHVVEHTTELYFEAHVTIEPVFDERLSRFQEICRDYQFRAAELMMQKRKLETPERSQYDTFATGRDTDYRTLKARTLRLVERLDGEGYDVWRWKIENTLDDVRLKQAPVHVDAGHAPAVVVMQ